MADNYDYFSYDKKKDEKINSIRVATGTCKVCGAHRTSAKHKQSNCSRKLQKQYEEVNK